MEPITPLALPYTHTPLASTPNTFFARLLTYLTNPRDICSLSTVCKGLNERVYKNLKPVKIVIVNQDFQELADWSEYGFQQTIQIYHQQKLIHQIAFPLIHQKVCTVLYSIKRIDTNQKQKWFCHYIDLYLSYQHKPLKRSDDQIDSPPGLEHRVNLKNNKIILIKITLQQSCRIPYKIVQQAQASFQVISIPQKRSPKQQFCIIL